MKNNILEKIFTKFANLDILIYLVWLLLIFLLLFTIKLQYFSILFLVISANIGLILFLIFKKKNTNTPVGCETEPLKEEENNCIQVNEMIPVVSSILFLIIYSASLLSLFLGEYTKTVAYYLCISVCAGILIVEILSYRTQIQGYWILLKAVLLSINVVFANHLIFIHGIALPDLSLHFNVFLKSILDTGHLSGDSSSMYNIFSIHHIFASSITILTGYNPLSIYLLIGSFIIAVGILFVFLIGKRFVNFQFGLVAALLFTCLDYYLMYGEHPEHQAYNYGFALICFTIMLFTYRSQKPAFYVLFIISTFALIFSHHLTAFIVFVTAFSLFVFDFIQLLQKKDCSLPSKYFMVIFIILIFIAVSLMAGNVNQTPGELVSSYIPPFFKDIYSLQGTIFTSPVPVISIPATLVPVMSIPATPVPVMSIPATPAPITPPPINTPTGYDKLSLITIFSNTLGASLLILISTVGFCSCVKKQTFLGSIALMNGIFISVLLGIGILFSIIFLLPDRLYPFLQICCLVFLGAFGILWLFNFTPLGNRSIKIGCVFILVAMMSFFSLASTINGFETSPFSENSVAYDKLYKTSQDVAFADWQITFAQNEKQITSMVPPNDRGEISFITMPDNSYLFFDRTLIKTGMIKKTGQTFGKISFESIDSEKIRTLTSGNSYYDNGLIIVMAKNSPA